MHSAAIVLLLSKQWDIQSSIGSLQEQIEHLKKREANAIQQLEDNEKALDEVRQAITTLGADPDDLIPLLQSVGSSTAGEHLAS